MKISIITVVYNGVRTIEDSILSVAEQEYADIEHVVIDGGSDDGTLNILEKHRERLAIVISEPDNGIYDAMNKGFSVATGELIGFLNADDVYASKKVLEKVATVIENSSVDACYSDLIYVSASNHDKIVRYWKSCEYADGLFSKGWCPPHPTFFARSSVYQKYGVFDLGYSIGNDVELMMRLLGRYKIKAEYIPEVLVKMRIGGVSNKSVMNIIRQNIQIIHAARKNNIPLSPLNFILNKIKSRISQRIKRA